MHHWPKQFLLAFVYFYQKAVSPWLRPACRFTPTCSEYAQVAITRYGACRGGWLALKRLARCHPLGGAGDDPVP